MPIQENSYDDKTCQAFFGGLLPESHTAKKIIANQFGVSSANTFALLKAIGYDCAGAISFHAMNEPEREQDTFALIGKTIDEDTLYSRINALPKNPLFLGFGDLRLSLAGVQDKAAVCVIDKKIMLPIDGCPTTHILKPSISSFEHLVENEYICLHIAKKIGIPIPNIEIHYLKDISYLLIQRYDRIITKNLIRRLHQEDFCQALKINSAHKYQNEGGPGFKDCFELLTQTSQPILDRNTLISIIVFNFLIGNMDAHGKNFSIIHSDANNISLAPFYDLICTRYYASLSGKMSMKIGKAYEADRVQLKDWEKFCETTHYNYSALKQLIKMQSALISETIDKFKMYYYDATKNPAIAKRLIEIINRNIDKLLKKLQ